MLYQTVLRISTNDSELRSNAIGWSIDSGSRAHMTMISMFGRPNKDIEVGLIPSVSYCYTYPTVLHALGDGFRLLAPPTKHIINSITETYEWEWWLVRDE
jgi:hypothetical protein